MSLETLELFGNAIGQLEDIGTEEFWTFLPFLRSLDLSSNHISSLSFGKDTLSALVCLESLLLADNKIQEIPSEFGNLSALATLNLSFNSLSTLPDIFSSLPSLSSLSLSHNNLSSLPPSLFSLYLTEANFAGNPLLGDQLASLFEIESLERLYLASSGVTVIPESVTNLLNLHRLDLSCNGIATLPEGIGELQSLESINVANNKIHAFPSHWGSLYSLLELNLSHNLFAEPIPPWIQEMPDRCVDLILDLNHGIPSDSLESLMRRKENVPPPHLTIGHADMIGHRPTMEDAFCIVKEYRGMSKDVFLGLYDGHAGRGAALFSGANHSTILSDLLKEKGCDAPAGVGSRDFGEWRDRDCGRNS